MRSKFATLAGIFALAVTVRWAYALVSYAALGRDGLMSGDAYGYLINAEALAGNILSGAPPGWDWLGRDLAVMPMFTWFVSLNVMIAGHWAPLTSVLAQGLFDAGTCLLVYGIASVIAPPFALAAGIAASLNPTQIVLSGILYNDTLFVFFVTLSFFGALHWLRAPAWRWALLTGFALAAAAMTRVLIVAWTPCLLIFLLGTLAFARRLERRHLAQLAVIGVVVLVGISPVLTRNVSKFQTWALTPQGGMHLALWVIPLIKESHDGTPWAEGSKRTEAEFRKLHPAQNDNSFVESGLYTKFAREKLWNFGPVAIAKAWLTGAAVNLAAPAALLSPFVSKLPRTGYYDTKGASTSQKIWNFLFHSDNAHYAWIALIGIAGVGAFRLLQLAGAFTLLRQPGAIAPLLLLSMWIGFILTINGPIASPKYRLPIEPVLALLTGAGFCALRRRPARTDTLPS